MTNSQPFNEALYIFRRQKPAHFAWLTEKAAEGNEFAASCKARIEQGRELTPAQAGALDHAVNGPTTPGAGQPQAAEQQPARTTVNVEPLVKALGTAFGAGLKTPFLITKGFKFKRAPMGGKNPGAIYVTTTQGGTYLGKIIGNELLPVRECSDEQRDAIVAVCVDPMKAAIEYGKETGICACCARELTEELSVKSGIGPVCAKKYGFDRAALVAANTEAAA